MRGDTMSLSILTRRQLFSLSLMLPVAACIPAPSPPPPGQSENQKPKDRMPHKAKAAGDLVELVMLDPSIQLDMRYATANNFTGRILYDQARAFLVQVAADALFRAHVAARTDGFGLSIYDAYRPWRVTKQLWDATPPGPKRNYVANPKQGSRHNRGCAVDLTLYDLKTGKQVEMPSGFDDFSARAHRSYDDDSEAARSNAMRLERYMQDVGFRGMSNEWWHFDFIGWEAYPIQDLPFDAIP